VMKRKSPFEADKNHMHHFLLRMGLGHKDVAIIMYIVNVAFVLVAFMLKDNSTSILLLIIGILAVIVSQVPIYLMRHKIADLEVEHGETFAKELKIKAELKS